MTSKFPKCEAYGLTKNWISDEDAGQEMIGHFMRSDEVEQALTLSYKDGAKAERERLLECIKLMEADISPHSVVNLLKAELSR